MPLTGLEQKDLKMIIFGGKGGVGKTSCSLACALGLAEKHKTLVISTASLNWEMEIPMNSKDVSAFSGKSGGLRPTEWG